MQKKNGISLIVLVITIIVMIILAAAIILSLNNSGIISKSNKAVKDTNEQEVNHIASLAWSEAYLNGARTVEELTSAVNTSLTNNGIDPSKYVIEVTTKGVTAHDKNYWWIQDGLNITKGNVTLEAGDIIQYNAGVSGYTGTWKVLGAEDGKLLIMSTEDVGSLSLYGLEGGRKNGITYSYGLLNGIERLNELCTPYGTGTGAIGARSIKVEDVDKLTEYDKTTFATNSISQYGNEVTYSWSTTDFAKVDYTSTNKSGTLSITHNSGFSYVDFDTMTATTVATKASGLPKLTNTAYFYDQLDTTLLTRSKKANEMIFGFDNFYAYWLASPYVYTYTDSAYFGVRSIHSYILDGYTLFYSYGAWKIFKNGVRAVVSLSPDIQIGEKDNTLGWAYSM